MSYADALNKLLSLTDMERVSGQAPYARRYDLSRVHVLLERLGNPHLKIPAVHITGTKGKGSTAAMIASVLSAQGYGTGLFTSPHLHTFRERIQFNGQPISEEDFAGVLEAIWPEVESMNADGTLGSVTTFELLTAMGFLYFYRSNAAFQVIEVGLGGRLDSTNVVQPEVCVFTSISLDHTRILGDTVELIAQDKSGIIKPGCVAVTSPQTTGVMQVLEETARNRGVALLQAERLCRTNLESFDLDGQTFQARAPWGKFRLHMPLLGRHQLENAATALVALHALRERGYAISRAAVAKGLATVNWPGRLEVVRRSPLVVVDGAHNPYSAQKLREALGEYFPHRKVIYVVGCSSDKNISEIMQELALNAELVVATRSRHPRSAPSRRLAAGFRSLGVAARDVDGVGAAVEYAMGCVGEENVVVVTGSLFVVAEAREALMGIPPEVYPSLTTDVAGPLVAGR